MKVEILVYGTEQLCASCVNLPSAKETAAWLEAAAGRKFIQEQFVVRYCDFLHPTTEVDGLWAKRIEEEDLWYPLVVISGEIVGEGNPKLKQVYEALEKAGVQPIERV
ncbi:YuzD family protein [Brevibacillus laterosporus]|uniref:Disulfide oxidoreductase n=1 Tax=Brevibacillus laterosporus TaxID=1465 RepID=A0AAP8QDF2_BRELA|nr:DUF1462 family protein [Brevibacillus laterosporus]PPB02232.1 disulfide oxidoreductase [Brevibacillus laterosporus]